MTLENPPGSPREDDPESGGPALPRSERIRRAGRWADPARWSVLALSDAAALFTAGTIAYLVWARPVHGQDPALYLELSPAILLFVVGYAQAGLYPGFGLGAVETLRRYWLVTFGLFVALAAVSFALKVPHQYSRMTSGIAFLGAVGLVPAFRWGVLRLARRWSWWAEPVVLVGGARDVDRIREVLSGQLSLAFRPVGIIAAGPESPVRGDLPVLGSLRDLSSVAAFGVRIAFATLNDPASEHTVQQLRHVFPRVVILRGFDELPVEGVQVRNLGGALGLEYNNNLLNRRSRWIKRAVDLVAGTAGFVLALPVIVLAVLAVKLLSRGPAFFLQVREGRMGRPIKVPKIRTMVADADARLEEHLEQDSALRDEWERGFKLKEDPRIIPVVGRLFRRFSIDELPQLWSVVIGEMSLVGPRPFPDYHLDALSPSARALRARVRPGITGLWQVVARGVADLETQQAYDAYYIRNWSLWLDLYILGKTVIAVVSGKGAY